MQKRWRVHVEMEVYADSLEEARGSAAGIVSGINEQCRDWDWDDLSYVHPPPRDPTVGGLVEPVHEHVHFVSVDPEPLPPSADEIADEEYEREREERRLADLARFFAELQNGSVYGELHLGAEAGKQLQVRGLWLHATADGATQALSVASLQGATHQGTPYSFVFLDRVCPHGTDRAFGDRCAECDKQIRYFIDGLHHRPVL